MCTKGRKAKFDFPRKAQCHHVQRKMLRDARTCILQPLEQLRHLPRAAVDAARAAGWQDARKVLGEASACHVHRALQAHLYMHASFSLTTTAQSSAVFAHVVAPVL